MNGTQNITLDTVKQNTAFINIKAYLDCVITANFSEKMLCECLDYIARLVKTYCQKYSVNLDDIIAEGLMAFAIRVGDYPNTAHFESYDKKTVCRYVRCHIINYCEGKIKSEALEKQKIERYVKYIK